MLEEAFSLLKKYDFRQELAVGEYIDAKDSVDKWCVAIITRLDSDYVGLHYEGWGSRYDIVSPIHFLSNSDAPLLNSRPSDDKFSATQDRPKTLFAISMSMKPTKSKYQKRSAACWKITCKAWDPTSSPSSSEANSTSTLTVSSLTTTSSPNIYPSSMNQWSCSSNSSVNGPLSVLL